MSPSRPRWWGRCLAVDRSLTAALVSSLNGRRIRVVMSGMTHTGSSIVWLAAGLGLRRWARDDRAARLGRRILWIWAVTAMLDGLLKAVFRRSRPTASRSAHFISVDRHAFPSGHAMRAGGLSMALASLLPGWLAAGLWVWGGAVCLSRVLLGRHYVGDVLVGWVVGLLTGVALRQTVF